MNTHIIAYECLYIYIQLQFCIDIIIYIYIIIYTQYIAILYVCLFAHVPKPFAARYAAPQSSADHSIEILSQAGKVRNLPGVPASKQGKCQPFTCSLVGKTP